MRTRLLAGLFGILAASCGSGVPKVLEASRYQRSCHSMSDCVQVFFGDVCSPCQCPNGTVNQEALKKYQADKAATSCTQMTVQCGPCEQVQAVCGAAGGCELVTP